MKPCLFRAAGFCLVVALLVGPAVADWVPADGHKMHFPQLPDEAGWDVNATQPLVLADDWQCSETGWVKDVHFWGSWKHGVEGQIVAFVLSIHADIPAEQSPTGHSMPGETLWEREVTQFVAQPIDPPSMEGWYDPMSGEVLYNDHQAYFQYNVFLPEQDWFWQEQGTIYWLNISAIVADPVNTVWGWKSTTDHWNDDAVWATWGNLAWVDMWEPALPKTNNFWITVDPAGQFVTGSGTGAYGSGWYYYPQTNWYTIWFYDDPFDSTRKKEMYIEFTVGKFDPALPSQVTIAANWSTPEWSAEGDDGPPLPGTDENRYIVRQILLSAPDLQGHFTFEFDVNDYNPEWVSIDVQGFNFQMLEGEPNLIQHTCMGSLDLSFVITGDPGGSSDTCSYYKSPYKDYAPSGMPDFDQKQVHWKDPQTLQWSHCGPVALANCFWWFDSKFEPNPIDPRPFMPSAIAPPPNDNYPLVGTYPAPGLWDDHDTNNVVPFVDSLALYAQTNVGISGTNVANLANGAQNWLNKLGLGTQYTVQVVPLDPGFPYEFIRDQVLESQDVILLIGFWQEMQTGMCERIGGHYVTVAGTCPDPLDSAFCISDPYFDRNEGEPPAGSAHAAGVHNDAANVSGPHGTIHHDRYDVVPTACQNLVGGLPFQMELAGYPVGVADIGPFYGQNIFNLSTPPVLPQPGLPIHAVLEWAIIICPTAQSQVDTVKCEPQGGVNPSHAPTYWYDVTPGGATPLYDFHVKVQDSIAVYFQNVTAPAGWTHGLHKVGSDWWYSWWDPTGTIPLAGTFRFKFDNINNSAWSDWVTTSAGSNNPTAGVVDLSGNHGTDPDGYGYRVHVPHLCCVTRGDATHDGAVIVSDLTFLVNYLFKGGPAPICPSEADTNGDGKVIVSDLTYLVNYLFKGGPAPVPCP